MNNTALVLAAVRPIVVLLALGVGAVIATKLVRLSPIVGYLVLGIGLRAAGRGVMQDDTGVEILAELGVVFLLFDIGLHFSLETLREEARDVFGFGAVQVLLGTLGLAPIIWLAGLPPVPALFLAATLALSSTAVVAPLIAERRQQNCPVGLTATAILIFQDLAAILLLIVGDKLGGDRSGALPAIGLALVKAAAAFGVAAVLARVLVRPLFDLIARTQNQEIFTAMALLVALAAGYATGLIGLSLTLGAFLGGTIIAETPYRAVITAEIKPFRGLLLSFFFISVGLSLDLGVLEHDWIAVFLVAIGFCTVKGLLNAGASLIFRWSVPGSLQLGFLIAQGSEFAFVVLSLPQVRSLIGEATASVVVPAVALSLAITPNIADLGRRLAGALRRRAADRADAELEERILAAPVLIIGMDAVGRTVADGLTEFSIRYTGIDQDLHRLAEATADGYVVVFGNMADPRLWEPIGVGSRKLTVLTSTTIEIFREISPIARARYPDLKRIIVVHDDDEARRFEELGTRPLVDRSVPPGLDAAGQVLAEMGVATEEIGAWMARQQQRSLSAPRTGMAVAA